MQKQQKLLPKPKPLHVLLLSNDGNANQIKNIADPTNAQDAATKTYVDVLLTKIEALEAREEANLIANGYTVPRDNNLYNVVKIGNQVWMAENLAYEAGTGLWHEDNTNATNETGFTALPGGGRNDGGTFFSIGDYGNWWSATEGSTYYAWGRGMHYDYSDVSIVDGYKELGCSVRCVRDSE